MFYVQKILYELLRLSKVHSSLLSWYNSWKFTPYSVLLYCHIMTKSFTSNNQISKHSYYILFCILKNTMMQNIRSPLIASNIEQNEASIWSVFWQTGPRKLLKKTVRKTVKLFASFAFEVEHIYKVINLYQHSVNKIRIVGSMTVSLKHLNII